MVADYCRSEMNSPQMRFLIACLRRALFGSHKVVAGDALPADLEWQDFVALLARHRVMPLVWPVLKPHAGTMPADVQRQLAQKAASNAQQALFQAGELASLSAKLTGHGIRSIALKGPALSLQAYGNLASRDAGDVDLWIDPARYDHAVRLILAEGYRHAGPDGEPDTVLNAAYRRHFPSFEFRHATTGSLLDLHWRCAPNRHLFAVPFDDPWARRVTLSIGGAEVATLPGQDQILFLCTHGARNAWYRLKWLCDVAVLATGSTDDDMQGLFGRALELGLERVLAQTLLLCERILGVARSPALDSGLAQDARVIALVHTAERALAEDTSRWAAAAPLSAKLAKLSNDLRLRKGLPYKLHCLSRHLLRVESSGIVRTGRALLSSR